MSRDWFAVQCRLVRAAKFRRLSEPAQLTLIHVWAIAGDESPEATWTDLDELEAALLRYARSRTSIDELAAAGWLDVSPEGEVSVHDWDEHQWAATERARNDWQAKYQREWRAKTKARSPSSLDSPSPTGRGQNKQHRSEPRVVNAEDEGRCAECHELLRDASEVTVIVKDGAPREIHTRHLQEEAA